MKRDTLAAECAAEFLGTALLIIFGAGVVSALILTGAEFGQWEISIVWGLGVAMAIYVTGGVSGAHLNPAVTIALSLFKGFEKHKVAPFIAAQVLGAFSGAFLVYTMYAPLFVEYHTVNSIALGTVDGLATAGIFSTYAMPQLTNSHAFMVEMFITAILMCTILAITDDRNGAPKGALGALLIGLLIAVIGCSFGPLTGFAMNPARDFGPKLFTMMAGWGDIALSGGRSNPYFWVPIIGPVAGACLGALIYTQFIEKQLAAKTSEPAGEPPVTGTEAVTH